MPQPSYPTLWQPLSPSYLFISLLVPVPMPTNGSRIRVYSFVVSKMWRKNKVRKFKKQILRKYLRCNPSTATTTPLQFLARPLSPQHNYHIYAHYSYSPKVCYALFTVSASCLHTPSLSYILLQNVCPWSYERYFKVHNVHNVLMGQSPGDSHFQTWQSNSIQSKVEFSGKQRS